MIGLLQRVQHASVVVEELTVARIGFGLLVFVGVERSDDEDSAKRLLDRVLGYRVFADARGKMNLSLTEVGGELLLVPQFTLAADTRRGLRASFTPAASPAEARHLYEYLVGLAKVRHPVVASGVFSADMQVNLTNSGPVTFWLQTAAARDTVGE